MQQYKQLVSDLKSDLHSLEQIYHERNQIQSKRETVSQAREQVADEMFEHLGNAESLARLTKTLESKDRELRALDAQLGGVTKHVEAQELKLHDLVPQACETFTRLSIALRLAVRTQCRQQISDLIHEDHRLDHQQQIDELTEVTSRVLEVSEIQIPSGGTWIMVRPLDQDRENTMNFVLQTARALTDSADELLVEIDKLGEMDVPEFLLGKLPEPEPEKSSIPQFEESAWQSPREREYILQLCKDAGKDFAQLSDSDKCVLQVSLENYRSQVQHQTVQMGHTSWDGTQS
jgi:hypothetical protein